MDDSIQLFDIYTLRHIPELVAWAIGIALAIIMVRRGGVKAEKLLLAGCVLMFVTPLASLLLQGVLKQYVSAQNLSYISTMQSPLWIAVGIIIGLLSLAGLVCLVWAFWVKFWTKKQETV